MPEAAARSFELTRDLQLEPDDVLILEFAALGPDFPNVKSFLAGLSQYAPDLKEPSRRLDELRTRGLVNQNLRCIPDLLLDVAAVCALSQRDKSPALMRNKRRSTPDPLLTLQLPFLAEFQLEQVVKGIRYPDTFLAMHPSSLERVVGTLIPGRMRQLQPLGPLQTFLQELSPKLTGRGKAIYNGIRIAQSGPEEVHNSAAESLLCEMLTVLEHIRAGKSSEWKELLYAPGELKQWMKWLSSVRLKGKTSSQPSWKELKGRLDLLFVGGVALWEEDFSLFEEVQPELRAAAQKAAQAGWNYVAQLFDQVAENRPGFFRDFLSPTAGWRRRLEGLLRLHEPDEEAESRVIWRLSHSRGVWSAEPYQQKRMKRSWSSGRNFLHGTRPQGLSRQDTRALKAFLDHDLEKGWRTLAGHPLLFVADQKVSLEVGEARLQVTRQNERISLRLEPPGVEKGWSLLQVAPDRFELVVLPWNLESVAESLGPRGLSVPEEEEQELLPLLGRLSRSLPIASDLELGVEERELHRTLYLRLSPQGLGLQLQALIRPFGPDSNAYAANEGPARLVMRVQSRAVQVTRDPEWEAGLLSSLGLEGEGPWSLPDPLGCLEFLERIKDYDPQELQVEWPEGQSFRLKSPTGKLQLQAGSGTDWFELSGGLELEPGQELRIQQILDLLGQAEGRFLALSNGEFIALSEEMAARLRTLAQVAEPSKEGSVKLHPLAAGFLEEIPDLELDQSFREHLGRLQQWETFQPDLPGTFLGELREYQLEGYRWLCQRAHWGVGACLADDMGLGKTIQTLAMLLQRSEEGPALVVAPTSVTYNWLEEAARFAPTLRLTDFRSSRSLESLRAGDVVICSYGLLVNEIERFEQVAWGTVVLDEAQAIKNSTSLRNQAVCRLRASARLATTGTPVENRLDELWSLFRFLNPGLLSSQQRFRQRFEGPGEVLRRLVHPFLLRRTKNQVLKELPPRTEVTLEVPQTVEERAVYEALRRQAVADLEDNPNPIHVLAELTRLRRACCHPSLVSKSFTGVGSKLQTLLALLQELKEGGHRALVFSQFVDHLSLVRRALEAADFSYQYLDGSTPAPARKQQVKAFQAGQGDVFLISLKAGGVGLNLTAADYVIHMDPWWNPAVEDQASDRAHRIGQLRPVTVYRLVAQNTVEDKIVALHGRKRDLAHSLLEGSEKATRLDAQEMLRLIQD